MTYEKEAVLFKSFCDCNRLQILHTLMSGEHCACKLLELLDVGQSTLSHHMKILCDAKVVNVRKEGKWSYYSLSQEGVTSAVDYLSKFVGKDVQVCCK